MLDLRRCGNDRPLLVGHRGAMDVAPENTMPSFMAGLAGGADILELDVQLTADEQVVVFHDDHLFSKAGVEGRVCDYPADYLLTLDVGRHFDERFAGTRMPLLSEVLGWARGRVRLMIELKHGPVFEPRLDYHTVELIEGYGMVNDVICTSFDQFALRRVKQCNRQIATSFIYVGRVLNPLALVEGLEVNALSPATNFLTHEEVCLIQSAGYACTPGGFYWHYPTLLNWGVDTISSNNPGQVTF